MGAPFFGQRAGALAPARIPPAQPPRALWIWGESRELLQGGADAGKETPAQREFFKFIAAPHGRPDRAVTTLYLGGVRLESLSPAASKDVQTFLTLAHGYGLTVEFLCGDASWARAAFHNDALAFLRAVLTYNRAVPREARFDGFQYDVEPYSLKEWPSLDLRRDFVRLFDRARQEVNADARTSGKLTLGAATPAWFDRIEFDYLDRLLLDRLDYLALMDYVNRAESLIERAQNEIAYASKIGKRVVIGVETQKLKDEPVATFFGKGNAAMESALSAAARAYKNECGFGGFAIHYLDSYRTFTP